MFAEINPNAWTQEVWLGLFALLTATITVIGTIVGSVITAYVKIRTKLYEQNAQAMERTKATEEVAVKTEAIAQKANVSETDLVNASATIAAKKVTDSLGTTGTVPIVVLTPAPSPGDTK